MNIRNCLLLVGLPIGLVLSAQAQTHPSPAFAANDLMLGFSSSSSTTNLEVNLGAASQFTSPSSSTFTIGALSGTDLSALYGSTWATSNVVSWAITGAGTGSGPAIYATAMETTPGVVSSPFASLSKSIRATGASSINSLGTAFNAFDQSATNAFGAGGTNLSLSSPASALLSGGGSWTAIRDAQAGTAFKIITPTVAFSNPVDLSSAGAWSVSDLYYWASSTGTTSPVYVGSIGINSSGLMEFSTSASTFGAAAVPEPSTYAAIAGALALGVVMIRRRQQAKTSA